MCPCGRNNGSSSGSAAIKLIDINLIVSLDFSGTRQVTFYTSVSSFSAKRVGNLLGVYRLMMMKGLQVMKNGKPVSQIFMNFFLYSWLRMCLSTNHVHTRFLLQIISDKMFKMVY